VDPILLALLAAIAVLLILVLVRVFSPTGSHQLVDLKNEIADLKTRQLESQAQALTRQQQLYQDSQRLLTEQLTRSQGTINQQLANTEKVMADVHQKLGSLGEAAKNIQEIGRDISSLQDILQAPKLRGNLGEYLLEDLLRQILPANNYEIKHSFRNGTQVDAVITLAGA